MRVIPVLDLRGGKVVHAVGGQREKYKPLQSTLVETPDPLAVARAFEGLGFQELYIADLDAICSTGRNLREVERIASQTKLKLMVDAGFRRAEETEDYLRGGVEKIVLATETVEGFGEVKRVAVERGVPVVASLDVGLGRIIARSKAMQLPLPKLIKGFEEAGASEILLLCLDRVGSSQGPDHRLLKEVLTHARVPVLVGGGIRNMRDIKLLKDEGASGALVATALHQGALMEVQL